MCAVTAASTTVIARLDRATQYAAVPVLLTNASGILAHPLSAVTAASTNVVARLDRAIQYAAATVFLTNASGILDHPLSRMMTIEF